MTVKKYAFSSLLPGILVFRPKTSLGQLMPCALFSTEANMVFCVPRKIIKGVKGSPDRET
jgi:hypothetical protein